MVVLSILVALVGALCLLDLLLTFGVIRRLKEHTALLAGGPSGPVMRPAGARVSAFSSVTSDGAVVTQQLPGRTLFAAFSPGCSACVERLPEFVEAARTFPGGRERVLVLVAGTPTEATEYADRVADVARVVIEPPTGPLASALDLRGYPSLAILDPDGTIVASGDTMDDIAQPAPA